MRLSGLQSQSESGGEEKNSQGRLKSVNEALWLIFNFPV
jgi:hypothetical protein